LQQNNNNEKKILINDFICDKTGNGSQVVTQTHDFRVLAPNSLIDESSILVNRKNLQVILGQRVLNPLFLINQAALN